MNRAVHAVNNLKTPFLLQFRELQKHRQLCFSCQYKWDQCANTVGAIQTIPLKRHKNNLHLLTLQRNLNSSSHNKSSEAAETSSSSPSDHRLQTPESEKEDRSVEMDGYIVGHDSKNKMFYITLQAQTAVKQAILAKLEYVMLRPNLVDLWHTEVPPEFQGHGIAKILAKAAFDHFCERKYGSAHHVHIYRNS